jgi:hypothetical protein
VRNGQRGCGRRSRIARRGARRSPPRRRSRGLFLAGSASARESEDSAPWTTFGTSPSRTGAATASFDQKSLKPSFFLPLAGRVTAQVLAAPTAGGGTTLFATTSDGPTIWSRSPASRGRSPQSMPRLALR